MDLGLDLGLGGQALRANEIETEVEIEGIGPCGSGVGWSSAVRTSGGF